MPALGAIMKLLGPNIGLRPATKADRRPVFEWLALSDVTSSMFGPPMFPESPPPTWDQFCADYAPHFFDGSRPELGRSFIIEVGGEPVGHVGYDGLDRGRGVAELDIWMRSLACCGRGYGGEALQVLAVHLFREYGVREVVIRPSARNTRARRAYSGAGFIEARLFPADQLALYGPEDYPDSVVMIKRMGV